jgi:hypothetical protein
MLTTLCSSHPAWSIVSKELHPWTLALFVPGTTSKLPYRLTMSMVDNARPCKFGLGAKIQKRSYFSVGLDVPCCFIRMSHHQHTHTHTVALWMSTVCLAWSLWLPLDETRRPPVHEYGSIKNCASPMTGSCGIRR